MARKPPPSPRAQVLLALMKALEGDSSIDIRTAAAEGLSKVGGLEAGCPHASRDMRQPNHQRREMWLCGIVVTVMKAAKF